MNDEFKWEDLVTALPRALRTNCANDRLNKCYYKENGDLVDIYDKEGNILYTLGKKLFMKLKIV